MKFQKFYIYFCAISWVVLLGVMVTLDVFWKQSFFDSTVSKFALLFSLYGIIPAVFSHIALTKSAKAQNKSYAIFNTISMIINYILGFFNFIYCIVYYSGGV